MELTLAGAGALWGEELAKTAPALEAGPPGWVAWAGLGIITGVGIMYMSSSKTETKTNTKVKTDTQTCKPPWAEHVHAQGTDIGGTTESTLGAPTKTSCSAPMLVSDGIASANETNAMLTKNQANNRKEQLPKLIKWVSKLPNNGGFLGQKPFENIKIPGGIRFDLDSYGPSNNFIY